MCLSPPRFMSESIFCIQLSPVMRTSFFTSGKSPQKVKKTVVSLPIAAAVVARMSVGQTLSSSPLHANMTNRSTNSGFLSATASAPCAAGGFSSVLMLISNLLLPQDEAVDAAALARLGKRVACGLRPGLEVRDGAGVRGECLEQLAGRELLHGSRGLDDRKRAGKPLQIERS